MAKTATPLSGRAKPTEALISAKGSGDTPAARHAAVPQFRVGEKAEKALPSIYSAKERPAIRMDAKAFKRLQKGKSRPDARIDLHGLTAAEAERRLTAFLLRAHANGARLVLVITGKGRERQDVGPIPTKGGVLRRELPVWLSKPPISSLVLQLAPAHQRHGGSGAFYVYLTRNR